MTSREPLPPHDEDHDSIPPARLAAWGVLALVIMLGVYLYFRYQPGIVPLNQKVG